MKKQNMRHHIKRMGHPAQKVTSLNEGPWRWAVGVQAGAAMGLPVALFTFLGNQSLGLMASLGGFTALYCAARSTRERMLALPLVAAGLVVASALGVLCSGNEWLSMACLVVVAALACILTMGSGLGPPGPIMFILVAAVSSHLAAPVSLGGAAIPGYTIPMLVAFGSILAYLVVMAMQALPLLRNPAAGLSPLSLRIRLDKTGKVITARIVAAVIVAELAATPLEAHRAYWVVIVAVAILQAVKDRRLTTVRAIQRVLGTLLGIILFECILFIPPSPFLLVLIIMVLQFATEVVVTRNYVLALIFITPLALANSTIGHAANVAATRQGRVLDTLLGAAIAMLVLWIAESLWKKMYKPKKA
ncbi:FUSC family protein [Agriterribacter sp.]|uniref:FUSC family protein n=1 Tax=Agriterribacter sp. TaxID=2821509 RepID=UPI002C83DA28|nr:FUSC family protein [Agriterribacter sp.]HRO47519.1 FUSC family protein [Agriterribacter sp.]HRQ18315.1 FUSC family protein [Agriterribacter sp.]